MPERIQQRRTKGWRKPANTVSVARPSKWGNPFRVVSSHARGPFDVWYGDRFVAQTTDIGRAREIAVERFRRHMITFCVDAADLEPLRGKDLMCFCPLVDADGNRVPCHADVLLELANRED